MSKTLTKAMLALAVPGLLATTIPASAAVSQHPASVAAHVDSWNDHDRGRHRGHRNRDYNSYGNYGSGYNQRAYYDEPVNQNTRTWQGEDGRYYCRRSNGTTGLVIGGAAGALLGREIAGRGGDRTLGAILGAAGGALLGRQVERGRSSCR